MADEIFRDCHDTDDFVRRLAQWRPGTAVPLIQPESKEACEAVRSLTRPAASRTVPDPAGALIAAPRGSACAPLARALAAAVGGRYEEFGSPGDIARAAVRQDTRWVVPVALASELTERDVTGLHDALWEAARDGSFKGHAGLLVGGTVPDVCWQITKGLALPHRRPPQEEHVRLWPGVDGTPHRFGQGPLLLRDAATEATVRPLLTGGHTGVLSVIAHGRDDVIHLHDTVICKGPDQLPGPLDDRAHLPVCAYTGQCFRGDVEPSRVLRAETLVVDTVFVNACMTWRIADGLFPHPYLLPHAFLAGTAAAYVGVPNLVNGTAKLNDLFHHACATGLSVGEAVSLVNDHLRRERTDLPYFTVLGLPWTTPATPAPATGPADTTVPFATVREGDADADGGTLTAAARALAESRDRQTPTHLVHLSPRSAPALAGAVPARSGLADAERIRDELRALGAAMTALEAVPLLGFRYSRQGNLMVNLRERIAAVTTALRRAVSTGDPARTGRRIDGLREAVRNAEAGLAAALYERGTTSFVNFDDLWGEVLEQGPPTPAGADCRYCARPLVRTDAVHPLFTHIRRTGLVCARCCMVQDLDPASPVADIALDCAEEWRRGSSVKVTLAVRTTAATTTPVDAFVAVHTEACERNHVGYPPPRRVLLAPGGAVTEVAFDADVTDRAHMHVESLRGFAVARGTLSFGTRPVWVRPSGAERSG
ncbi:hypothetical protein [Streptomyces sp. NPDC057509]|uniref:hypothetical protein n=1 Tax=Streptomyces sp. NPDC057509 TaxID=3346152 RepID=UPI00368732CF